MARLAERGVVGEEVDESSPSLGMVSVGKRRGSTGVDGPFPIRQLPCC